MGMSGMRRGTKPFLLVAVVGACVSAQPASAVMLVELNVNAASRPYGRAAPVDRKQQEFSVPSGPGTVVMTYTESTYVGGPGGFWLTEKNLSNDALGFGGACVYTPRETIKGQPYRVQCTWLRDFSKKNWMATLTARHDPANGRQFAGVLTLNVEFIPGTPQDSPRPPAATPAPPPAAPPTPAPPQQPAPVAPPPATPAPVAPPTAAPPTATPPTAAPPPAGPNPVPPAPPAAPPPPAAPVVSAPSIRGSDSFDSTSFISGDPFDGGEWRNARNGSATATRTLARPACVAGVSVQGAGTDVNTAGSVIQVRLVGPSGVFTALDVRDAAINRDFSPGPGGPVLPPQARSFAPFATTRIEVAMSGHGWFLLRGLKLSLVPCP
jgi:hypothetical protein